MHTYKFLCILVVKHIYSIAAKRCSCLWYRYEWNIFILYLINCWSINKSSPAFIRYFLLDVSVSPFKKKSIFYNCFQLCYGKHCKMYFREEGPVNSAMGSICVDVGCTAQPAPAVWSNRCSSRVEIRQAPFVFHFLFSFFLNNILSKNKDFFSPPDLYWSLHLSLDKIQLWNLCAVSSQNWNDSEHVFPGWMRFNNDRNFIYCIHLMEKKMV